MVIEIVMMGIWERGDLCSCVDGSFGVLYFMNNVNDWLIVNIIFILILI